MPSKPFSPEEAGLSQITGIPDVVFDAMNELLSMRALSGYITIKQTEFIDTILRKSDDPRMTREALFDNGWLDIEDAYRKVGWKVEYDKPGYNESYDAFFVFTKK